MEKIIRIQKHAGKVRKKCFFGNKGKCFIYQYYCMPTKKQSCAKSMQCEFALLKYNFVKPAYNSTTNVTKNYRNPIVSSFVSMALAGLLAVVSISDRTNYCFVYKCSSTDLIFLPRYSPLYEPILLYLPYQASLHIFIDKLRLELLEKINPKQKGIAAHPMVSQIPNFWTLFIIDREIHICLLFFIKTI